MDHVISHIAEYMETEQNDFIKEWQSGLYKNISECPSYGAVKAYCDARNVLSKYYYGKAEYETPRDIINSIMEGV